VIQCLYSNQLELHMVFVEVITWYLPMIIKSSAYLYDTVASFHNVRWTNNILFTIWTTDGNICFFPLFFCDVDLHCFIFIVRLNLWRSRTILWVKTTLLWRVIDTNQSWHISHLLFKFVETGVVFNKIISNNLPFHYLFVSLL